MQTFNLKEIPLLQVRACNCIMLFHDFASNSTNCFNKNEAAKTV